MLAKTGLIGEGGSVTSPGMKTQSGNIFLEQVGKREAATVKCALGIQAMYLVSKMRMNLLHPYESQYIREEKRLL